MQVTDQRIPNLCLNNEGTDELKRGTHSDCGVIESQFPCNGKCCSKNESISGPVYIKDCLYCSIWTSLPVGESLAITNILECSLYGYDKMVKE